MTRSVELMRKIPLASIVTDAGTQMRVRGLDDAHVAGLVDALARGRKLVEPDVFFDGERYLLADGFHRVAAYQRHGRDADIVVRLHDGDLDEAKTFAAGTNAEGRREYSNEDKRHAVDEMLAIHADWSNVMIAEHCHVDEGLVRDRRKRADAVAITASSTSEVPKLEPTAPKPAPRKTVGRDGRARSNVGQKEAGARRAVENALAALRTASDTTQLGAAYARVAKLSTEGKITARDAESAEALYRAQSDAIASRATASEPATPKAKPAPAAQPASKGTAGQRAKADAVVRAMRELLQRTGELLDDNPLLVADAATQADALDVAGRLVERLRSQVIEVLTSNSEAAE